MTATTQVWRPIILLLRASFKLQCFNPEKPIFHSEDYALIY